MYYTVVNNVQAPANMNMDLVADTSGNVICYSLANSYDITQALQLREDIKSGKDVASVVEYLQNQGLV